MIHIIHRTASLRAGLVLGCFFHLDEPRRSRKSSPPNGLDCHNSGEAALWRFLRLCKLIVKRESASKEVFPRQKDGV